MQDLAIPPTASLAQAEASAINALAAHLSTEEGRTASDNDLKLWLIDRGWPPNKLRLWSERIAAQVAFANGDDADPRLLATRLSTRLDRLALRAEEMNDMKHAIEATKVQATLNKIGGFAPAATQSVQVNITNGTAHLASDDELLRIANAKPVDASVVEDPLLA